MNAETVARGKFRSRSACALLIKLGDSLITTTTINSGGWKDEPDRTPTIHDIRREIRRIPSGSRQSAPNRDVNDLSIRGSKFTILFEIKN